MNLALLAIRVTAAIANFIAFEMRNLIRTIVGLGFIATIRLRAYITVFRMEAIIHVAAEVIRTMEPRASSNKDPARKPFWPVVAIGSAIIRSGIVIAIGTCRCNADFYGNLSSSFRSGCHHQATCKCRHYNTLESVHNIS